MDLYILLVGLIVIIIVYRYRYELYGDGALIQLYAKGPEDMYLTGDAYKYIPPVFYNYYWNYPYRGYRRYLSY
jgi:hypothetical protein